MFAAAIHGSVNLEVRDRAGEVTVLLLANIQDIESKFRQNPSKCVRTVVGSFVGVSGDIGLVGHQEGE